ncbi:MAG: DUF1127 domain-containing protein [Rhodobacteraceae bacterium]|nr:MAG: DUF1127 domain-containing protein [Paracoccaceae bacterium]
MASAPGRAPRPTRPRPVRAGLGAGGRRHRPGGGVAAGPDAALARMTDLGENTAGQQATPKASLWRRLIRWVFRDVDDRHALRRLSDHHLRDIGLTRGRGCDLFDRRRDPRF